MNNLDNLFDEAELDSLFDEAIQEDEDEKPPFQGRFIQQAFKEGLRGDAAKERARELAIAAGHPDAGLLTGAGHAIGRGVMKAGGLVGGLLDIAIPGQLDSTGWIYTDPEGKKYWVEPGSDAPWYAKLAGAFKSMGEAAERTLPTTAAEEASPIPHYAGKVLETDVQSIAPLASALLLPESAPAWVGAVIPGILYGASEAADFLDEADKEGIPRSKSGPLAVLSGVVEGGLETIADILALRLMGGAGVKALKEVGWKNWLISTLKNFGADEIGEISTEIAQMCGENKLRQAAGMKRPDITWQDVKETGTVAGLAPATHLPIAGLKEYVRNDAVEQEQAIEEGELPDLDELVDEVLKTSPVTGVEEGKRKVAAIADMVAAKRAERKAPTPNLAEGAFATAKDAVTAANEAEAPHIAYRREDGTWGIKPAQEPDIVPDTEARLVLKRPPLLTPSGLDLEAAKRKVSDVADMVAAKKADKEFIARAKKLSGLFDSPKEAWEVANSLDEPVVVKKTEDGYWTLERPLQKEEEEPGRRPVNLNPAPGADLETGKQTVQKVGDILRMVRQQRASELPAGVFAKAKDAIAAASEAETPHIVYRRDDGMWGIRGAQEPDIAPDAEARLLLKRPEMVTAEGVDKGREKVSAIGKKLEDAKADWDAYRAEQDIDGLYDTPQEATRAAQRQSEPHVVYRTPEGLYGIFPAQEPDVAPVEAPAVTVTKKTVTPEGTEIVEEKTVVGQPEEARDKTESPLLVLPFEQYVRKRMGRYAGKFKDNPALYKRLVEEAKQQWRQEVIDAAANGRLDDSILDEYIDLFGEKDFNDRFRGIYSQEDYMPKQRREELEQERIRDEEHEAKIAAIPEEARNKAIDEGRIILTTKKRPYKTEKSARLALKSRGLAETHDVVEYEGGYALAPKPEPFLAPVEADTAPVQGEDIAEDKQDESVASGANTPPGYDTEDVRFSPNPTEGITEEQLDELKPLIEQIGGQNIEIVAHDSMEVDPNDESIVEQLRERGWTEEQIRSFQKAGGRVAGSHTTVVTDEGVKSLINLSLQDANDQTIFHELTHRLFQLALHPKEKAFLLKKYGSEEGIADAFQKKLDTLHRRKPVGAVEKSFAKMKELWERVRNFATAKGWNSETALARKMYEGEYAGKADEAIGSPTHQRQLADLDAEYFDALAKGDEEKAQKLVEEAAKRAEYGTGPVYHGTDEDFTVFDRGKLGENTEDNASSDALAESSKLGFWASSEKGVADILGRSKEKPVAISGGLKEYANLGELEAALDAAGGAGALMATLKGKGFGGIKVVDDEELGGSSYVAFEPNQIKSLDTITRDDEGNIIPLSQRFNPNKDDIRYQPVAEEEPRDVGHALVNMVARKLFDHNYDIKRAMKTLKSVGKGLDLYELETSRNKATAALRNRFWSDEVEPLLEFTIKSKLTIPQIEELAHAQSAESENARLKRLNSKDQLLRLVKELKDKGAIKKRSPLHEKYMKLKEAMRTLKKPYEYETLLDSIEGDFAGTDTIKVWRERKNRLSGMTDTQAKKIKAAYKNNKPAQKAARMLLDMNRKTLELLHKKHIISDEEYLRMKAANPNYVPLHREGFEDDAPVKGSRNSRPVKTRGGSTRKVVNILENSILGRWNAIQRAERGKSHEALLRLAEENPDKLKITRDRRGATRDKYGNIRYVPDSFSERANQYRFVHNGERYTLEVDKDNKPLMAMIRVLKGGTVKAPMPVLGDISRWVSRVNTTLSIPFMVGNVPIDAMTGAFNLSSTPLKNKQHLVLKEVPAAIKELSKLNFSEEVPDDWRLMEENGGVVSWADNFRNAGDVTRKLKASVDALRGKDKLKFLHQTGSLIENLNSVAEQIFRYAAFKAALKEGLSPKEAAKISSELTIDFTKHGEWGPLINSLYPFSNATIQGTARLVETLKTKEGKAMAAGLVALGFLQGMFNAMHKDDDDVPFIDKVPQYLRNKNLILTSPKGTMVSMPMPYGLSTFVNIGDELARMVIKGKDYIPIEGIARLFSSVADAFNPVGTGPLAQQIAPTAIDPAIQIATNQTWYGAPLLPPESPYAKSHKPRSERYYRSENPILIQAADYLNRATGGNKAKAGKISISPTDIRVILDFAFGSAGKMISRGFTAAAHAVKRGGKLDVNEVPILNRFYRKKSKYADQTLFYNSLEKVAEVENQLKEYKNDPEMLKDILSDSNNRKMKRLIPKAKEAERQLRYLRKQKRAAERQLEKVKSKGMKRLLEKRIDAITKRENAVYLAFNKLFHGKPATIPIYKPASRSTGTSIRIAPNIRPNFGRAL